MTTFPFDARKGAIFIRASASGPADSAQLRLLLDTGASLTSLRTETLRLVREITVSSGLTKVALSLRDRQRGRGDGAMSLGTSVRKLAVWLISLPVAERQGYLVLRTKSDK